MHQSQLRQRRVLLAGLLRPRLVRPRPRLQVRGGLGWRAVRAVRHVDAVRPERRLPQEEGRWRVREEVVPGFLWIYLASPYLPGFS